MTLLIFQFPGLCLLALVCAGLSGLTAKRESVGLFWLSICMLTVLVIAALVCMLSYTEVVLLLLPAVYAAFFFRNREGQS